MSRNNLKFMRLIIFALITSLLSLLPIFAQSQPTFRIALLVDAQSSLARGAQLRVNQINQLGGVVGADGSTFRLELTSVDLTAPDPVQIMQELEADNVVALLGTQNTQDIQLTGALLTQINRPVFTTNTDDSLLLNNPNGLLFRATTNDYLTTRALVDHLITDRGLTSIQIIQFDAESTIKSLNFQTAAINFEVAVPSPQVVLSADGIAGVVQAIQAAPPDVIVMFGNPILAGQFYTQLRTATYAGLVTYPQATAPDFLAQLPSPTFNSGLIGAGAWSIAANDRDSNTFISDYIRAYNTIPDANAAMGADAVMLISEGIGLAGTLKDNLLALNNVMGVQGVLSPATLAPGETSANAVVYQLNHWGGSQPVSRYIGEERIDGANPQESLITPTPAPTATPDGVVVNIVSDVQNVRSGPSTDYDVLGQLEQGEQIPIIGTTMDYTWLVIQFRGQRGWIANLANLNEVFGDLNDVPVITPPATPTPVATATTAPPQEADIIIQSASVVPNPIVPNNSFTISAVVANVGRTNAGNFAIAMNMPPNNTYVSGSVGSLNAGATTTVTLSGTVQNTGSYSAILVADLNNDVSEGVGEGNNEGFGFTYRIDQPVVNSGTQTANPGDNISLSSNVVVNWSGTNFNAVNGQIGQLNVGYDEVHYDLINTSSITSSTLTPAAGWVVGVRNTDGKRGLLRVDSINGSQVAVTYRAYD